MLCILTLLALTVPPTPLYWWSAPGHRVVAQLAWDQLPDATRERVRALLGPESLAAASTWADSIRPFRRETAPWHYVNIPLWAPRYEPDRDCPQGQCVIAAIDRFRRVLADTTAPGADRAEALRFLVHFVADLHQPLHVADRGDRGGNDVHVTVKGRERTLHAVWDDDLVANLAPSEPALRARLRARLAETPDSVRNRWGMGSVVDWAMAMQPVVRDRVYRLPAGKVIDQAYLDANAETVETALLQAAVRLAVILRECLGPAEGSS